ncbi:uridine kinase [Mycobacterium sp. PDNC021]|uniref:uridine kinase n=1 Tax=Mycobacterium sp. PDNC021 TaxID=3391399 RepID=UPI003AAC2E59
MTDWDSRSKSMGVAAGAADAMRLVAMRIPASHNGSCPKVAIDGPDGAGKTYFADELADLLRAQQRPVVRVSLDDFHNTRAVRYRLGRDSPEGFWLDSYNYRRFHSYVVAPFSPGGSRKYRTAAHDLTTDAVLNPAPRTAAPGTVLIVDGIFLHRNELGAIWDFSVFLDVPFVETARRMASRDGTNPDPDHPSMRRYVEAQRRYFQECSPQQRATVLIDNTALGCPVIVPGD